MEIGTRRVTTDRGDGGQRLDLVLRRHLTGISGVSRTRVQHWIEDGRVAVNGRLVRRVAARTAAGDVVSIVLPDPPPARPVVPAQTLPLRILYEDEHLLAVDKPAGVVAHPAYRQPGGTLIDALRAYARDWPNGTRPSLVGRLDKLTSGVVLVAKTTAVHARLQRCLSSPASEKDYLAIVYGRVRAVRGEIALRVAPDPRDRRRMIASDTVGAPSLTRYMRLARSSAPIGLALLRCRLATGRRHQIRVHLATRGWPLVGDPVYGQPQWTRVDVTPLGDALRTFPRQALHAWRLAFTHPITGARLVLEAPVPADLQALLTISGLASGIAAPTTSRGAEISCAAVATC